MAIEHNNATQRITIEWLRRSSLTGNELLLEALLRRGFLVFRDEDGVWLAKGSHPLDLEVLSLVAGLEVEPVHGHERRMARVKVQSPRMRTMDIAIQIATLPSAAGHFLAGHTSNEWDRYRNMVWGAKVPACHIDELYESPGGQDLIWLSDSHCSGTPDMGVTLLVKAFPLGRILTTYSCDGHGSLPALICFGYIWCGYWAEAVFDTLEMATPNSKWDWDKSSLKIEPIGGYGDAQILNMFNDIQYFARRLMEQSTIDKIGRARIKTLQAIGDHLPTSERFVEEARRQLAVEFAAHSSRTIPSSAPTRQCCQAG